MNYYKKYILPEYLRMTMGSDNLRKYRQQVVSDLSGVGLEIGFGFGLNLQFYKNISKLYALDPSLEISKQAQKNIKAVDFPVEQLVVSAEDIPLPDSSVDFVVSTWSICSIPQPEKALKELYRVLKANGVFVFVEHGRAPNFYIHIIQNFFTPISKSLAGGCHLNRDIESLINNAGFRIIDLEKFYPKMKPLSFLYKGKAIVNK